jgi:hypothetical protein
MKKLLTLTLLFASIGFASISAEATTGTTTLTKNSAEYSVQPGRYRQARVYYRTRYVRVRGRLYRETLQYRQNRNGRLTIRVVSRVRVR